MRVVCRGKGEMHTTNVEGYNPRDALVELRSAQSNGLFSIVPSDCSSTECNRIHCCSSEQTNRPVPSTTHNHQKRLPEQRLADAKKAEQQLGSRRDIVLSITLFQGQVTAAKNPEFRNCLCVNRILQSKRDTFQCFPRLARNPKMF